jgi:hypothetical protein
LCAEEGSFRMLDSRSFDYVRRLRLFTPLRMTITKGSVAEFQQSLDRSPNNYWSPQPAITNSFAADNNF